LIIPSLLLYKLSTRVSLAAMIAVLENVAITTLDEKKEKSLF